ncbi:hypothetical protein METUNv1_00117 [Methyloversatilis universalis FAM5]|uniref:SnoaL-like domain-containing protein n=1 Tax=Methyloversatilis universalis (strain ATCC BAA-1314 / DSM 25237 / JCM 13912 / CCUG 52030 / FAM5) TaxID=1000565 RepID=F5R7N6_METUF|nr:nuclear transport factor 2 family protein [Methyloversatilis universalis]EGK73490.1 hypothetical protein METUNv1_00117 [Methyloversatilis universalis FAM5]
MAAQAALDRLIEAYTSLEPARVPDLAALYADDARFRDPFNDVRGRAAVARIFSHMYSQVDAPRFEVTSSQCVADTAWLEWVMHFEMRGRPQAIVGATRLLFDAQGRVTDHRDYWDAAQELYEKLPLIGSVLRAIRRRLAAG